MTISNPKLKQKHLAQFANFLIAQHLDNVVQDAFSISKELKVPLISKFGNFTPNEALKFFKERNLIWLTYLGEDRGDEYNETVVKIWISDQLAVFKRDEFVAEDISLIVHGRKRLLTQYIRVYTQDLEIALALVSEIDDHLGSLSTFFFKAYLKLLGTRVAEQGKITETLPDATEKQKLVEQLQYSEELYKQAQALAHLGNWEWDIKKNKVIWTDELFRIYGLEPQSQEISFETFLKLVHPEDAELVKQETTRSLETKQPNHFFHRLLLADGTVKVIQARSEVQVDSQGNPIKLFGTALDVTEQKNIEKKLQENQTFIQKIADATPAIIASYHFNTGVYVFVSQGIKALLGYDRQKLLNEGLPFLISIIHPDDFGPLMEKNMKVLQEGYAEAPANGEELIMDFQYRVRHANGEYRWLHTFGTVFNRNEEKKIEHILNISLDITERVNAEQILHERTQELQRSNAQLEEFAFVTSHDLKEPLRKIATFSNLLLNNERKNLSEHGVVLMEKIMASSRRLQQMINDLLSLSLISSDKSFEVVSLHKIWQEVVINVEHKLEETKATVYAENLPNAHVVPSLFRQLFQNLLNNSLKFTREGTSPTIRITSSYKDSKELEGYALKEAKKYLYIEFADNGIGFDNVHAEKIFSIFQRLHTKNTYEGTGIGLAICKKIAENHGGTIIAKGAPGEGAIFTIIIPADLPE